jgi:hypothetical protein
MNNKINKEGRHLTNATQNKEAQQNIKQDKALRLQCMLFFWTAVSRPWWNTCNSLSNNVHVAILNIA